MNAILPINIIAIRVSNSDADFVTSKFQGNMAGFDKMPNNPESSKPSIGENIYTPLTTPLTSSPENPLQPGIHIHWELPDYFRKGQVKKGSQSPVFPASPNRWLITRFLCIDPSACQTPATKSWVIESDYVSDDMPDPQRPAVSVPISSGSNPYMYMGRVVDLDSWTPPIHPNSQPYLPGFTDNSGNKNYLTAVGLVGAHFNAYYPECCSVFGFYDNFTDTPLFDNATKKIKDTVQFKVSYQVSGWIDDNTQDPLNDINLQVLSQYQQYLKNWQGASEHEKLLGYTDFFKQIMTGDFKWSFNDYSKFSAVLENNKLVSNYPTRTICAGIVQEIGWQTQPTTTFLQVPDSTDEIWSAAGTVCIGNTPQEALAALINEGTETGESGDETLSLEILLNAMQSGLLKDLATKPDKLIAFEEILHKNGFSSSDGGKLWIISKAANRNHSANSEADLPIDLAELLHMLNTSQKSYDMQVSKLLAWRKQFFLDWIRWSRMVVDQTAPGNMNGINPILSEANMGSFISSNFEEIYSSTNGLEQQLGILQYITDPDDPTDNGIIPKTSSTPYGSGKTNPVALDVVLLFQQLQTALKQINDPDTKPNGFVSPGYIIQCVPAPHFYMPAEPALIVESDHIDLTQRNLKSLSTVPRLSSELISKLSISCNNITTNVSAVNLSGRPVLTTGLDITGDLQSLVDEACLTIPMFLGPQGAEYLASIPGCGITAQNKPDACIALMNAAGGLSPLDGISPEGAKTGNLNTNTGLFELTHQTGFKNLKNITVDAASNAVKLNINFTNADDYGYPMQAKGWMKQAQRADLATNRYDPFVPVLLLWEVTFYPLIQQSADSSGNSQYSPENLTSEFTLDSNSIDFTYSSSFTSSPIQFSNHSVLSSNAAGVMTNLIDQLITEYPGGSTDPDIDKLDAVSENLSQRLVCSLSMADFNRQQLLLSTTAQVPIENLVNSDQITSTIVSLLETELTNGFNWYSYGFNSHVPLPVNNNESGFFGPLRAGFLDVQNIEIVDLFGQRMQLNRDNAATKPMACIPSFTLTPLTLQTSASNSPAAVYFPPRLLTPSRLWFRWLSANHNNHIIGIDSDFVEMNSHPSTTPVCGWLLPDHLDKSLFFYNSDGSVIGSFAVDHAGTDPAVRYSTWAGNDPLNTLTIDIGPEASPLPGINRTLSDLMWTFHKATVAFFEDFLLTLSQSQKSIAPQNFAQDISLSVLIGKPLAITRAVIGLESAGNWLPLNQVVGVAESEGGFENGPFLNDVLNRPGDFAARVEASSANIGNVRFPVLLGDIANLNDGLVGYFKESGDGQLGGTMYSPAAPENSDYIFPVDRTPAPLQLTINGKPDILILLVDPRASVHATTGILPVHKLSIPQEQYSAAMKKLAVSFAARPMLYMKGDHTVPVPSVDGYSWSFISRYKEASEIVAIKANQASEQPKFGYSPQSIQEGWVALTPDTESK